MGRIHKIGRRKTAVARVYVSKEQETLLLTKNHLQLLYQLQLYVTK